MLEVARRPEDRILRSREMEEKALSTTCLYKPVILGSRVPISGRPCRQKIIRECRNLACLAREDGDGGDDDDDDKRRK